MTFFDKGQIFKLYDKGLSLEEISEITNYNANRLRWTIEAIRGTQVWTEAIAVYEEASEYGFDDKRPRLRESSGEIKTTGTTKVLRSKEYSGIGAEATKVVSVQRPRETVSWNKTKRHKPTSRSKHNVNTNGVGSRGSNGSTIIEELRKHVDYRGE